MAHINRESVKIMTKKDKFEFRAYNEALAVGDIVVVKVTRTELYDSKTTLDKVKIAARTATRIKLENGMSFPYRKTKLMVMSRNLTGWSKEYATLFPSMSDYETYTHEKDLFERKQNTEDILQIVVGLVESLPDRDLDHIIDANDRLKKAFPEYVDN